MLMTFSVFLLHRAGTEPPEARSTGGNGMSEAMVTL